MQMQYFNNRLEPLSTHATDHLSVSSFVISGERVALPELPDAESPWRC